MHFQIKLINQNNLFLFIIHINIKLLTQFRNITYSFLHQLGNKIINFHIKQYLVLVCLLLIIIQLIIYYLMQSLLYQLTFNKLNVSTQLLILTIHNILMVCIIKYICYNHLYFIISFKYIIKFILKIIQKYFEFKVIIEKIKLNQSIRLIKIIKLNFHTQI